MEDKKPLLSICIPTYNRAYILKITLKSIVTNIGFDNDVEVVISDNSSTDNTQEVVQEFAEKYHNIKYFCNQKNIKDENFYYGLRRCNGEYIKLQNDYLGFSDDGLLLLKQMLIRFYKKQIFFTGNMVYTQKKAEIIECDGLDDYITAVSTFVTWISVFGIWANELSLIQEPLKYAEKSLCQVDWTYQLILAKKYCVIIDTKIYQSCGNVLGKRSGYNYFGVHVENYYYIMDNYKHLISEKTFLNDKKHCLLHFRREIFYTFIYRPPLWQFDTRNSFSILCSHFYNLPVFYAMFLLYPLFFLLKPFFIVLYGNGILHNILRKIYRKYIQK
jgi:glycosyltransferase involved in cell wall biosynthesis